MTSAYTTSELIRHQNTEREWLAKIACKKSLLWRHNNKS